MTNERMTITLALVLSQLCPAQPATTAAKFEGTWKENEAKRKIGSGFNLRFRSDVNGGLQELRGPETRPVVQPVNFDGKPHKLENSQSTIVWKQNDSNHFERTISAGGKLINTKRISIFTDGKTLTEVTELKTDDGKDLATTVVYKRASGDAQGLAGIWTVESVRTSQPAQMKIEAVGTSGLRITRTLGATQTVTFDGKPNPVAGPGAIPGTTIAAKLVNDHTIDSTSSREGVVTAKGTMALSTDGRTLTWTFKNVGPNAGEPGVTVFEKQ